MNKAHPTDGEMATHRRGYSIRRMMRDVMVIGCVLGLLAWFYRVVERARDGARSAQCVGNLKQIGLAMLIYESTHGCFPPAVTFGPDGKPWHSWRMLILPVLEQKPLYNRYNFDEPWDGPSNRKLHAEFLQIFACPNHPDHAARHETSYVVVVGPVTAFPGPGECIRLSDVHDGESATILLVESSESHIHWMEPRDLDLGPPLPRISSRDRYGSHRGPHIATIDDSIRSIDPATPPATLRAWLSINGGEVVEPP